MFNFIQVLQVQGRLKAVLKAEDQSKTDSSVLKQLLPQ